MDDPHLFAGRNRQVSDLIEALHSDGACPIIYGDRGLGKTSLAVQAERIARGDTELLHAYQKTEWSFDETSRFETVYLTCSDDTKTFHGLLRRLTNLILGQEAHEGHDVQLVDRTSRVRFSVKVIEAEQVRKYAPRLSDDTRDLSIEESCIELLHHVIAKSGHPLLVIFDELDRVPDTRGLASFIKAYSSSNLKFLLVGIAQNVSSLLSDHLSIERTGIAIRVPPMSEMDLINIVRRAQIYLRSNGILRPSFTAEATRLLASLSGGFPWFVHVIGQDALLTAYNQGTSSVSVEDVIGTVHRLTKNRFAQKFADRYQQAVRGSEKREYVLRAYALCPTSDLPIAELNNLVKTRLSVGNPGYYRRQLSSPQYGSVLMSHPFHKHGVARFCDEMFKVFVRLSQSTSPGVDYLVQEAWEEHRRLQRGASDYSLEEVVNLRMVHDRGRRPILRASRTNL